MRSQAFGFFGKKQKKRSLFGERFVSCELIIGCFTSTVNERAAALPDRVVIQSMMMVAKTMALSCRQKLLLCVHIGGILTKGLGECKKMQIFISALQFKEKNESVTFSRYNRL